MATRSKAAQCARLGVSSVVAAILVIWVGERVSRSALVRSGYVVYVVALLLVAVAYLTNIGIDATRWDISDWYHKSIKNED